MFARPDEASVQRAFYQAIAEAPPSLFPNFESLRPILLGRSAISRNRPLFCAIADRLISYARTGVFPGPVPYPRIQSDITARLTDEFLAAHRPLLDSVDLTSPGHIRHLLAAVQAEGIHLLCGLRATTGSARSLFPPPSDALLAAFNERHKGQPLSVGGRAFSKHSVRDSSRFWGVCGGSSDFVNECALKCLNRIIDNCVWMNVFALPHDLKAFEIRVRQGYGVRWEFHAGGIVFRGFVEPPMEDGHIKKWRH
jgi:hypothetical protein